MQLNEKNYCFDCGRHSFYHLETYLDDLLSILPQINYFNNVSKFLEGLLEKIFLFLGIFKYEKITNSNLNDVKIPLKLKFFTAELLKENFEVFIGKSIFGYTHHFIVKNNFKKIKFCSLPVADFLNPNLEQIDNKIYVKKILAKNNFPVAPAKIFWLWQKKKAIKYAQKIGWPVVLKPNTGSVAQHVYTNIFNETEFNKAFKNVIRYSPRFLVEKFIPGFVFRITIIDFKDVFCVKQIPANVCGDGKSNILELISQKNKNRAEPHNKNSILYKILKENIDFDLLAQKNYDLKSIPQKDEIVYLVKDPFLRLGGDLVDQTDLIHPENKNLFLNIAKLFNIRIVGIDFIAQDISVPWQKQNCAILELNTSPSIELHLVLNNNFSNSASQNILSSMVNFFKKYYL